MDPSRTDLSQADDALVLRAQNGDHDAFGELVNRHQRRVWMVCRQYVGVGEADAAAQDSLVKAFTRIGDFDRRAAFSTWLTRIAINTCLDELRRRKREAVVDEEPENDDELESPRSAAGRRRRAGRSHDAKAGCRLRSRPMRKSCHRVSARSSASVSTPRWSSTRLRPRSMSMSERSKRSCTGRCTDCGRCWEHTDEDPSRRT